MAFSKLSIFFIIFTVLLTTKSSFSSPVVTNNCNESYCLDQNWPDFSVSSLPFYGSAVVIDKRNRSNIIILHRSTSMSNTVPIKDAFITDDVIMIVDALSGQIISTWGGNKFVRPHGIEITTEGDIFIADVKLHQVLKFQPNKDTGDGDGLWENYPSLTLGERFISGNDQYHFCSPADIAVMSLTKDIFVADGYCNSRIVKFNEFGLYLDEFGAGSSQPNLSPVISFNVSHSMSIAIPNQNLKTARKSSSSSYPALIFVADRNNGRIQCFTENGTFLYEITHDNFSPTKVMIFSLAIMSPSHFHPYGKLFAINGNLPFGQSKVFVIHPVRDKFQIVDSFSISIPLPNGNKNERNEIPHDITVTPDGTSLYVIEAYRNLTVKKFTRNMATSKSKGCHQINRTSSFLKSVIITMLMRCLRFCSLSN